MPGDLEGYNQFHTTRWSLIAASLDSQASGPGAGDALAQLCRIYWRPIFAFVCRRGYSVTDAQDLTQDFFLMVLKGDLMRQADRDRGKFRSLLLKTLQNFLIDAHIKSRTRKRGGEVQVISWDEWMAEAPSRLTIPSAAMENWPAERIYDVRWAATLAEEALHALQEECEKRGRRRVFDILSGALTAEREDVCYKSMARELGIGIPEVKRLLHRLRQRYRQLLREEVAGTVQDPADVDEELRYLCSALAAGLEQEQPPQTPPHVATTS
jgi:RNA polymerase sigma-70 factor (ECF subfamily)